jgi:hypothetical protein
MAFTLKNVLIGAACIIVCMLLLELVRSFVEIPGPVWLEQAIATAVAIIVWFAIVAQTKKA